MSFTHFSIMSMAASSQTPRAAIDTTKGSVETDKELETMMNPEYHQQAATVNYTSPPLQLPTQITSPALCRIPPIFPPLWTIPTPIESNGDMRSPNIYHSPMVSNFPTSPAGYHPVIQSPHAHRTILQGQHPDPCLRSQEVKKLEEFAHTFKIRRIKLGYTQKDVGHTLGEVHGTDFQFSQTTICRFENLQCSYKSAQKLKPILEKWLEDAEKSGRVHHREEEQSPERRKKRQRRRIGVVANVALENHFIIEPKPSSYDISKIAKSLHLEKNAVQVWFTNRRQREKRVHNFISNPVNGSGSPITPTAPGLGQGPFMSPGTTKHSLD